MRETLARLIDWMRRDTLDRELTEELQFHRQQLEREIENSARSGSAELHDPSRRMGNITAVREAARERWSIPWIDNLQQDVRYALRGIRRNPGFTAVVVATLALGLGVNAAVFSLVDRLFVQPPGGVESPEMLHRVYATHKDVRAGVPDIVIADEYNYPEIQALQQALAGAPSAMYRTDSVQLTVGGSSRMATATYADGGYWKTVGASLELGRAFTVSEARIEVPGTVAIISHRLWQREFNSDRELRGKMVTVAGKRFDVIGVAAAQFRGLDLSATDVWLPIGSMSIDEYGEGRMWYQIYGIRRLKFIVRAAPASIVATNTRLARAYRIRAVAAGYESDSNAVIEAGSIIAARGPLKSGTELEISKRLVWVSLLVLLIACANVANLLLTRLTERKREIAVRLALGVSRLRLANQFVVETLALTTMAVVAALLVGSWAGGVLRSRLLPETRWDGAVIEPRLIAGIIVTGFILAIILAMVPVLHVRQFAAGDALKSGQRSTSQYGNRLRTSLLVGQTAMAVVLLTGAVLCAESLRHILAVNIGYDVDRIAMAWPQPRGDRGGYASAREEEVNQALRTTAERLLRQPGVAAVSLSDKPPLGGYSMIGMRVPGLDSIPKLSGHEPRVRNVEPEYWSVAGLRRLQGRLFTSLDASGAPMVVVVDEAMARTIWPKGNAIGQCVILYRSDACRTVVGIVSDARWGQVLEEPTMHMYVPLAQGSTKGLALKAAAIAVRADPKSLAKVVAVMQESLAATLPNADMYLQTMREKIEPQYRPWKLGALLFAVLASLGLAVASVGLYGVIAYGVRRRTHELGIRSALGAERRNIVLLVLRQGVSTVMAGLAVGIIMSMALVKYVASLVYETSLASPVVFGVVGGIMLLTAVIASFGPAWQAGRISPMTALRSE